MSIDPTTAAKFDIFIAAEENLFWTKRANPCNTDNRKVRVAQRAYDAAKAMLTPFEIAQLEEVSGRDIA